MKKKSSPKKKENIEKPINYQPKEIENKNKIPYIPLSIFQEEIYLSQLINSKNTINIIGFKLQINGPLDTGKLIDAIKIIVDENDILRYQLLTQRYGKKPYFSLQEKPVIPFRNIDFSMYKNAKKQYQNYIYTIENKPTSIENGPLYELGIIKISEEKYCFYGKFNHILIDGKGAELLLIKAIKKYNKIISSPSLETPSPNKPSKNECSYATFSEESIKYMTSKKYDSDIEFWRNEMQNYPSPWIASHVGKTLPSKRLVRTLSNNYNRLIEEYCEKHNISSFHYFISVIAIYFSAIYNKTEIVIGIPVHNKKFKYKKTIGLFTNILPLYIKIDTYNFDCITLQVKRKLNEIYRYKNVPFGKIIRHCSVEKNIPYDIKLSFEKFTIKDQLNNCKSKIKTLFNHYQNHPLSIFIRQYPINESTVIHFDYQPEAFSTCLIRGVLEKYKDLLLQPLSGNKNWNNWDWISDENKQQMQKFNDTKCSYRFSSLHEVFEKQAETTPDNIAISFRDDQLSYSTLNKRANQLANYLLSKNLVQAGDIVAIHQYRSLYLMECLLAVLKLGAAYLPLDPESPTARNTLILSDANVKLVLGKAKATQASTNTAKEITWIDPENLSKFSNLQDFDDRNPSLPITPDSLAYVIYTSGSTGKPKGVMVEHHSVLNRIIWQQKKLPINSDSTLLQKTPYFFDVSVWELFWWFFEGASLRLLAPGEEKDPATLLREIHKNSITVMHFVPSMLGIFLDFLEESPSSISQLSSLQHIICSGEALPKSHVDRFYRLISNTLLKTKITNLYGPTEACIDVSYFQCTPENISDLTTIPIGYPIDNTEILILDKQHKLLPIGMSGELAISGVGLARGYLNNSKLTQQKFIQHPHDPTKRIYLTGDLAQWKKTGEIEYLGRKDYQVKVRGNRVELGEIESHITSLDYISDAAVISIEHDKRGTQLAAYYSVNKSNQSHNQKNTQDIRHFLSKRLPNYMVPAYFQQLEEFPLTASGKLDRKSLPQPQFGNLSTITNYQTPKSKIEKIICSAYEEVLDIKRVGIHDNFYALGGDSILMLKILAILGQQDIELELSEIQNYSTIEELGTYLTQRGSSKSKVNIQTQAFSLLQEEELHRLTEVENV